MTNKKSPKLDKLQLEYLFLFTNGHSDGDIYNSLGVNKFKGEFLKENVKKILTEAYGDSDWKTLIKKCLSDNVLSKNNFIPSNIIELANVYTEQIFTESFISQITNQKSTKKIESRLVNFISTCELLNNKTDQ
jgi:hypothetical protein